MISNDGLQQVVTILGSSPEVNDQIERQVLDLVGDSTLTERLVEWIPEVFGFVLVSRKANIELSDTFSAKSRNGDWVEIPLDAEPIWKAVTPIAMAMLHSGPKQVFRNIAVQSAIIDAVNKVRNAGDSIEGGTWSIVSNGIPAEVYTGQV